MDWSYVAGLFDGEGNVGIQYSWSHIEPYIGFTASESVILTELGGFLEKQGIGFSKTCNRNPLGRSKGLRMQSWESCEKITNNLLPFVVGKKKHLEIFSDVINLYKHIKANGDNDRTHLREFDMMRRRLHALAKKGPKQLKLWPVNYQGDAIASRIRASNLP
jgi:hypothetical protein